MAEKKEIYCCTCEEHVQARLTDGFEIYPHRQDLASLPYWKCDTCKNHVGCHHKTKNRTQPLGCIPSKDLKEARKHIHAILDPIWKGGKLKRHQVYNMITERMDNGHKYHTAQIRSVEEARHVYQIVLDIRKEIRL